MKVTKRQLMRIIKEELAHSAPLDGSAPVPAPKEVPAELPEREKSMRDRAGEEAMAGFLLSISDEGRKTAVTEFMKSVGDKPWELVTGLVDALCDRVSSWDSWGSYQSSANKVCQLGGRVMAAPTFGVGKVAFNGFSIALSMIPTDMINDFAADSYSDTVAGKIAMKKKTARLEAEKKSAAKKRKAMKESIRKIVAKEINRRER